MILNAQQRAKVERVNKLRALINKIRSIKRTELERIMQVEMGLTLKTAKQYISLLADGQSIEEKGEDIVWIGEG